MPEYSPITDPEQWLRNYEAKIGEIQARAERVQDQLKDATVTMSSPDRAVSVTVNPGGQLLSLTVGPRAEAMTAKQLVSKIMELYGRASLQAGEETLQIMSGLVGNDSAAMDFLKTQIPHEEPE